MRKPDPGHIAPLARLKVGTKLMLLVLLPVCVLLGFTGFTALADWHAASQLQDFRAATRLSFATAAIAVCACLCSIVRAASGRSHSKYHPLPDCRCRQPYETSNGRNRRTPDLPP